MPEGKDVMVSSKALVRTVSSVLAGTLACVSGAQGAPNSGLDLTQPILQAGYSYQSTYFYPGVSGDTRAFTATLPLSFGQLKIAFPFSQVRHVLPSHVSTCGKGDLTLSYNYVLPVRSQRFRQTFGVAYESPSGLRFSSREQQIGPLYEFAYRLNDAASLLVLAEYAVGYNAAANSARYNELTLSPRVLFALRSDTYAALVPEYHRYSGDRSDATYDSTLDVGRVFSGFNVMAHYGLPLGTYSYQHLYRSSYGLSAAVQL